MSVGRKMTFGLRTIDCEETYKALLSAYACLDNLGYKSCSKETLDRELTALDELRDIFAEAESSVNIPLEDFRRLIGSLGQALNNPTDHYAGHQLGAAALRTLRDYLPESIEEARQEILADKEEK